MEVRKGKSKGKEKDYHHGDLKRALVQAALDHLEHEGTAELTLRDLARKVGVSHAAPYRHFPDKKALLLELAEEGFKELLTSVQSVREIPGSEPLKRFSAIAIAYVRYGMEHPARLTLMFGPEISDLCNEDTLPSAKALQDLVVQSIEEAQSVGIIAPGDPKLKALAAWSMVHGLSMLLIAGRLKVVGFEAVPPETVAAAFSEMLMRGMANV